MVDAEWRGVEVVDKILDGYFFVFRIRVESFEIVQIPFGFEGFFFFDFNFFFFFRSFLLFLFFLFRSITFRRYDFLQLVLTDDLFEWRSTELRFAIEFDELRKSSDSQEISNEILKRFSLFFLKSDSENETQYGG